MSGLEALGLKIGLEIHCQLTNLKTKLFCSCPSDYRGKKPNTVLCPVCAGEPGALPVLNEAAVEDAVMIALALGCTLSRRSIFSRKNYFYPDMPKNFQISQYEGAGGTPLAVGGRIPLSDSKEVRIRRIQLEEDPGKLSYEGTIDSSPVTLVDYNRAGVALIEIVTEPDMNSPREARVFLQKLRSILEHLGVSDGSLGGAMRCDANISLRGGKRVEIKNISSFKDAERALSFEITRQRSLLGKGIAVTQETRHWDDTRRITVSLRVKEEERDYRYFPEPDLLPIVLSDEFVQSVKSRMPPLPEERKRRYVKDLGLSAEIAEALTSSKSLADFFEACMKLHPDPVEVGNWVAGDLLAWLNRMELEVNELKLTPQHLAEMLSLIEKGTISGKIAKKVLEEMVKTGDTPSRIVEREGLVRIDAADELEQVVDGVLGENPEAVRDAIADEKAVHFLVGQVMKATRGRADPQLANKLVREKLQGLRG
ncbi:MAG: Asp-tRNA(Asn)/Glu-tRNA(Gln) amidotransferase subunit GatB [Candidatus Bathyarchaeia archaeon]